MNDLSDFVLRLIAKEIIDRLKSNNIVVGLIQIKEGAISTYFDGSYEAFVAENVKSEQTVFSIYLKGDSIIVGTLFADNFPGYQVFMLCDPNLFEAMYQHLEQLITKQI